MAPKRHWLNRPAVWASSATADAKDAPVPLLVRDPAGKHVPVQEASLGNRSYRRRCIISHYSILL